MWMWLEAPTIKQWFARVNEIKLMEELTDPLKGLEANYGEKWCRWGEFMQQEECCVLLTL